MSKVRFETSNALGLITLANPPLNLFDQELIDDLRAAVDQARQHPLEGAARPRRWQKLFRRC